MSSLILVGRARTGGADCHGFSSFFAALRLAEPGRIAPGPLLRWPPRSGSSDGMTPPSTSTNATGRATSAACSASSPRARRRPPLVLRSLRPSAPRTGVRGYRDGPGRPHHGHARQGPRQPGLRRAEAARAAGRHGRRPRPLLDHGRQLVGERAARLARRPARGRARPQRQPRQRRRAAHRAAGARRLVPLDLGLGDHRRAALHARGGRRSRTRSRTSCRASRAPSRPSS